MLNPLALTFSAKQGEDNSTNELLVASKIRQFYWQSQGKQNRNNEDNLQIQASILKLE